MVTVTNCGLEHPTTTRSSQLGGLILFWPTKVEKYFIWVLCRVLYLVIGPRIEEKNIFWQEPGPPDRISRSPMLNKGASMALMKLIWPCQQSVAPGACMGMFVSLLNCHLRGQLILGDDKRSYEPKSTKSRILGLKNSFTENRTFSCVVHSLDLKTIQRQKFKMYPRHYKLRVGNRKIFYCPQ